jgi:phosphate acetyltransferase
VTVATLAADIDLAWQRWTEEARARRARVAFADGDDSRVIEAAAVLRRTGWADPVLIEGTGRRNGSDALLRAASLVRDGGADALVAGSTRPTAHVVRAALAALGRPARATPVTSFVLLALLDGRLVAYGDCGVLPEPDASQLAHVAVTTASGFERLTGERAVVALLSFSTKASAEHPSPSKVRAATELARRRRPDLAIDGELQFDAAYAGSVAALKNATSEVAGHANVFVFPNLDAANIAYKLTEQLAGARAYGPLLQGLARPVHDLSRGCSVEDVVASAVIAGVECGWPRP